MKNYLSLFMTMLWLNIYVNAQTYSGDLTLATQSQINSFNYSDISGKLTIGLKQGSSDITDLAPLSKLQSAGSLYILNNNSLSSLKGLEGVTAIGKVLYISSNDALKNMKGLHNVKTIGNNFYISYNDGLINLDGLDKLQSIGRDFFVSTNIGLQSLQGIDTLQTIKGSLILVKNKKLTDVDAISRIVRVPGNLVVENNNLLSACCSLKQLTIRGQISVSSNGTGCSNWNTTCIPDHEYQGDITLKTQTEVDAFKYTKIYGSLTIGGIPNKPDDIISLANLSALESVTGDFYISNCDQLESLHGLEKLKQLASIGIYGNSKLKNLQGLNNLEATNWLYISHNDALSSIQGLDKLQEATIAEISKNKQLLDLQGISQLKYVVSMTIKYNALLTNLEGLQSLYPTMHSLVIQSNTSLKDLQGIENLYEVDEKLVISFNNSLTSFKGLDNLQRISNSFDVVNNPALSNIEALSKLESVYNLYLSGNTSLGTCCVLLNTEITRLYMAHNATGCNSGAENIDACTPSTNPDTLAQNGNTLPYTTTNRLQAYPNPVIQSLHLQGYTGAAVIRNALGQPVKYTKLSGIDDEVDLSHVPAGVYILQVADHDPVSIIRQ